MNPYYASPAMTGMGGGMDPRMQGMPGMQGMMHPGMMNGIHPGMMGGMGQMGGNNGMGLGGSVYGQAHKQLV